MEERARPAIAFSTRVAVTLLAPALLLVAGRIDTPGIDHGALQGTNADFGIFALGLTPIVSAYLVVELFALAIPRWRKLRFGGAAARAPIERAARIVTVLFAISQAAGVALSFLALPDGSPTRGTLGLLAMTTTWVAATCLLLWLAQIVTRFGCVNGLLWLWATTSVPSAVARAIAFGTDRAKLAGPTSIAVVFLALVVAAVTTWLVTSPPSNAPRGEARDARSVVVVAPLLVCSIVPFRFVSNVLGRMSEGGAARVLASPIADVTIGVVGAAILALPFAWIFHAPHRVAEVAARFGGDRRATEEAARSALRKALPWTLLYLAVLFVCREVLSAVPGATFAPIEGVAFVTVVFFDLLGGVRAHAVTDGVVVAEELRSFAVSPTLDALARHGIRAEARGVASNVLFRSFAPFAPVQILVHQSDAEKASRVIAGAEAPPSPDAQPAAVPLLASPMRRALLGLALPGAAFLLWGARHAVDRDDAQRALPVELRVTRVLDDVDPFEKEDEERLPRGASVSSEVAPLGGEPVQRHYVRFVRLDDETIDATRARAKKWLSAKVPAKGATFALGDLEEIDEAGHSSQIYAVRTYLVDVTPVLSQADVERADVAADRDDMQVVVVVALGGDAAQRFADATSKAKGSRLAIVVNDNVTAAPVVQGAITGGHVSISVGGGDYDDQVARAKALAASLRAAASRR